MKRLVLSRAVRFAGAAFIFICTVQALHWPLFPKPGTQIEWWQVRWLARVGEFVGLPVLVAALPVGRLELPSPGTSIVLHLLAVIWSLLLFWLAGRIWKTEHNQSLDTNALSRQ